MSRPRSSGPTQAAVAARAGVSVATVSKALRADPVISAPTRTAVLAAARELGYRTPMTSLPAGGTDQAAHPVTAVFDSVDTQYAAYVLRGLLEEAELDGVWLRVRHIGSAMDQLDQAHHQAWERSVLEVLSSSYGVVLVTTGVTPAMVNSAAELSVPLVAVDPATAVPEGTSSIGATNHRGGQQAVTHLLELGHRRIGIVTGPLESIPATERLAGYRSALATAGITPEPQLVRAGGFDYDSGLVQGGHLLDLQKPPTAIVAGCDATAVGVIEAARRRGLRVPEDLSVVGFDDTLTATVCSPRLTTIHQPLVDIGAEAMRTVIRLATSHGSRALSPIELATSLVVRDSTAPPLHTCSTCQDGAPTGTVEGSHPAATG
ncbi:LacI family DNA-binding transcriptional regulator [Actinomyces sp.]|uniref:LacI family DNA-binding transcriptional regulator n=1 Tax=Actinomyces sp. TaxID=29317 RepID=UPI0026DDA25D|nr:LacI family DNA-binding transcriptional regulator [Actinomyces sp.]MDO4900823.1 LacI family DNA-binding transcriptional regulator [Actinomyces sp.]